VVTDETIGEEDPLLAKLLAAATAGAAPAGPAKNVSLSASWLTPTSGPSARVPCAASSKVGARRLTGFSRQVSGRPLPNPACTFHYAPGSP
jgi:hypothetical protein